MNKERLSFSDRVTTSGHPDTEDDEIDIHGILRTLWWGKKVFLLLMALGCLVGWYYDTYRVTPYYRAQTTLTLEVGQDRLINFQGLNEGFYGDDASVTTEIAVMTSRKMLGKLVDELDLLNHAAFNPALQPKGDPDPIEDAIASFKATARTLFPGTISTPAIPRAPMGDVALREGIISALGGMLSVTNQEWSYVLIISATSRDPQLSERLSNTLARLYIEDRLEVKFERSRQATEWLTDRVVGLQAEVERSSNELKRFLAEADLVSEDALSALNLRLKDQRDRLAEARALHRADEDRLVQLGAARASQAAERVAEIANDPPLTRLAARLVSDPDAAQLFVARTDVVFERLRGELDRRAEQISVLERAILEQESAIAQQSDELVRVEQMEREAEANRLLYEYFLTRLKETSVQEGLLQADARIISPAIVPAAAFNPNGNRGLLLGTLLGLGLGVGIVLLRERLITAVRTPDELEEATELPVLGQIPRIPGRTRPAVIKYLAKKPASAAAEAVRNLRTSLVLSHETAPPQLIVVTSALPGEGKSTTAVALAQNYAGLGKKVLLIESDIRRRTLAKLLGLTDNDANMLTVLRGENDLAEAVQRSEKLNFETLLGSTADINPADVLSSEAFGEMLREARQTYDVVIVDTPPLLIVPDARIVAQYADSLLFVVLWNRTTLRQIKDALKELSSIGVRASGLVLSNVDPKGMRQLGYGQRYGAYDRRLGRGYYRN